MYCSHCGNTINDDYTFCAFCGTKLHLQGISTDQSIKDSATSQEKKNDKKESEKHDSEPEHSPGKNFGSSLKQDTNPDGPTVPNYKPDIPFKTLIPKLNWELILGGEWLVRIGVIAVIIGIGFFLKLAIENDWVTEEIQIILGVFVALIFIISGDLLWKRYPIYSHALSGGGIAILYLTILAASVFYSMIDPIWIALILLLLIGVVSVRLSLIRNSQPLAAIGLFGAFLGPPLLDGFSSHEDGLFIFQQAISNTSPENNIHLFLFAYIVVINVGVMGILLSRNWLAFRSLTFVGSYLHIYAWVDMWSDLVSVHLTQSFISIIFALLIISGIGIFARHPIRPSIRDFILIALNPLFFILITANNISSTSLNEWSGNIALITSIVYFLIAYLIRVKVPHGAPLSTMLAAIGLVLMSYAIFNQFSGAIFYIVLSVYIVVLYWLSFSLKIWTFRALSIIPTVIVVYGALFVETFKEISEFNPIINERFIIFLSVIIGLYLSAVLCNLNKQNLTTDEGKRHRLKLTPRTFTLQGEIIVAIESTHDLLKKISQPRILLIPLLIFANLLTVWILSAEWIDTVDNEILRTGGSTSNLRSLGLSLIWAVYASIILLFGILKTSSQIRIAGLLLLAIPILKLFIHDTFQLDQVYRIIAYLSLGFILIIGGFMYQRYRERIIRFLLEENNVSRENLPDSTQT